MSSVVCELMMEYIEKVNDSFEKCKNKLSKSEKNRISLQTKKSNDISDLPKDMSSRFPARRLFLKKILADSVKPKGK